MIIILGIFYYTEYQLKEGYVEILEEDLNETLVWLEKTGYVTNGIEGKLRYKWGDYLDDIEITGTGEKVQSGEKVYITFKADTLKVDIIEFKDVGIEITKEGIAK